MLSSSPGLTTKMTTLLRIHQPDPTGHIRPVIFGIMLNISAAWEHTIELMTWPEPSLLTTQLVIHLGMKSQNMSTE
ncbi:hypothetical protein NDU88_002997 [Pleurodeles waltl]|uniref:Uncharacterized protein n=1 Tax=Pleurodeles waltl TaxID=8319 RepID=A0AAV7LKB4_PLEWA|nr:hypothetical protein NDU88_002997 [Pleurodeles waltl]